MLNKSHLQSTDKYVMAGEYVVEGFRSVLGEDKYNELRNKLFSIKSEAAEKIANQIIDRPMDHEI